MKKIGIYYGSTTGTTETIAGQIAEKLGVTPDDTHAVSDMSADSIAGYDVLLLGSSTWGAGDLQDDWYDGVDVLRGSDLSGKTVALFGCGDCESYPDTFCGALGAIYDAAVSAGARVVGAVPASDYTYDDSDAVRDGQFVGLALDDVNESDKTADRIAAWTEALKAEIG